MTALPPANRSSANSQILATPRSSSPAKSADAASVRDVVVPTAVAKPTRIQASPQLLAARGLVSAFEPTLHAVARIWLDRLMPATKQGPLQTEWGPNFSVRYWHDTIQLSETEVAARNDEAAGKLLASFKAKGLDKAMAKIISDSLQPGVLQDLVNAQTSGHASAALKAAAVVAMNFVKKAPNGATAAELGSKYLAAQRALKAAYKRLVPLPLRALYALLGGSGELLASLSRAVASNLSDAELADLTAFSRAPAGKKLRELSACGNEIIEDLSYAISAEVEKVIDSYGFKFKPSRRY